MIKNECYIIRDLIPSYVEETLSDETCEFIKGHIEKCDKCSEILTNLKEEEERAKNEEKTKKEKEEIDYLRKYNIKLNILKAIAIVLALSILVAWIGIFGEKWTKYKHDYKKAKPIYDVINSACNAMEELGKTNNIKCYDKEIYQSENGSSKIETIYYYKDGKLKGDMNYQTESDETKKQIEYGVDNGESIEKVSISIDEDRKRFYTGSGSRIIEAFNVLDSRRDDVISCLMFNMREDVLDNRQCYVLKNGSDISYLEIWIDKETNLIVRKKWQGTRPSDSYYKWETNVVTDEDIEFIDFKGDEIESIMVWGFLEKYEEINVFESEKYKEEFNRFREHEKKLKEDLEAGIITSYGNG